MNEDSNSLVLSMAYLEGYYPRVAIIERWRRTARSGYHRKWEYGATEIMEVIYISSSTPSCMIGGVANIIPLMPSQSLGEEVSSDY